MKFMVFKMIGFLLIYSMALYSAKAMSARSNQAWNSIDANNHASSKPVKVDVLDSVLFPENEPTLSVNEPMYFVVGGSGSTTAHFQFSFKYRIFDPDSTPVDWFQALYGLQFGYTQTSIWDLSDDSAPFYDTSYRPSFFWQGNLYGKGLMPKLLRGGFEHESNGKDGDASRSINTLFLMPFWGTDVSNNRTLIVAPKFYVYLEKSDNEDIQQYRGYVDWNVRFGNESGRLLTMRLRYGTAHRSSTQIDFSYPLRKPLFNRTGGFVSFQIFRGYGESILDYDKDNGTQLRIGFSMVR
ncbi:MAG: phospholipase [Gammaproteobacteria bacterium]|nr:MAG: phospholipase [Gammaproteobacteria bacterium]